MSTAFYDQLRHFADSWGLLLLTLVFVGVVFWVSLSGKRQRFRDQADIPFKYDERD